MTWTDGIDASFSRITVPDFQHLWGLGYRIFCQCLWTGGYQSNPGVRAVAEANLRDAEAAGFLLSGYTNASPWFDGGVSVAEAKANAGGMWDKLRVIAVDVEIDGTPEAHIKQTCELLLAQGHDPYIYSARWFWDGHMGNPRWPWLTGYKIWNADYDGSKMIDWNAPWGPWAEADIVGKQFAGTTKLSTPGGRSYDVDLNVFDQDFFQQGVNDDMPDQNYFDQQFQILRDTIVRARDESLTLESFSGQPFESLKTQLRGLESNGTKARFGITTQERDAFIQIWLSKVLDPNIKVNHKDIERATAALRKLLAG